MITKNLEPRVLYNGKKALKYLKMSPLSNGAVSSQHFKAPPSATCQRARWPQGRMYVAVDFSFKLGSLKTFLSLSGTEQEITHYCSEFSV